MTPVETLNELTGRALAEGFATWRAGSETAQRSRTSTWS